MGREDFARYLGVLYFGSGTTLRRYINRAYRDFNRTLHVAHETASRQDRVKDCGDYLLTRLTDAKDGRTDCRDQDAFDAWHETTCEELISRFGEKDMLYGHAQKWVNMTMKYLFTAQGLGLDDIGGIAAWYPRAHMPVDNVVLDALKRDGFDHPRPNPWSKLDKVGYLAFQKALRDTYEECPMDVEFMLWRGIGKPTRIR